MIWLQLCNGVTVFVNPMSFYSIDVIFQKMHLYAAFCFPELLRNELLGKGTLR